MPATSTPAVVVGRQQTQSLGAIASACCVRVTLQTTRGKITARINWPMCLPSLDRDPMQTTIMKVIRRRVAGNKTYL